MVTLTAIRPDQVHTGAMSPTRLRITALIHIHAGAAGGRLVAGRTGGEAAERADGVLTALRATDRAQRRDALIYIQTGVPLWAGAEAAVTVTVKGAWGVQAAAVFTDTEPQALVYICAARAVGAQTEALSADTAEGAQSVHTVPSRAAPRLQALVYVSAAPAQAAAVSRRTVTPEGAHRVDTDSL